MVEVSGNIERNILDELEQSITEAIATASAGATCSTGRHAFTTSTRTEGEEVARRQTQNFMREIHERHLWSELIVPVLDPDHVALQTMRSRQIWFTTTRSTFHPDVEIEDRPTLKIERAIDLWPARLLVWIRRRKIRWLTKFVTSFAVYVYGWEYREWLCMRRIEHPMCQCAIPGASRGLSSPFEEEAQP